MYVYGTLMYEAIDKLAELGVITEQDRGGLVAAFKNMTCDDDLSSPDGDAAIASASARVSVGGGGVEEHKL